MEPSIRSSSFRPSDTKLRRTDSAVHETIQRFVESQWQDLRISQYADVNYAAKKFTQDKWYWLMPNGYSGYLVFLPKMPAIWIDEQFKKSYKIPIRVSSQIYEKSTVMIASLNMADAVLRLEDVWLHAGRHTRNTPFTQRWERLLDFFSVSYKPDAVLQGLRIETAIYEPLSSALAWDYSKIKGFVIAQGETYQRRLRVQMTEGPAQPPAKTSVPAEKAPVPLAKASVPAEKAPAAKAPVPLAKAPAAKAPANANAAIAMPHPQHPDTYDLWINGVKKGYAAVQDIELSRKLRAAVLSTKELRVSFEWNAEFSMYEINDLLD